MGRNSSSEFQVEAEACDEDRAAVTIVAGIGNGLKIEGSEDTAPDVERVVAFGDGFTAVGEAAVAEQETVAAERKILLVIA